MYFQQIKGTSLCIHVQFRVVVGGALNISQVASLWAVW